MAYKRDRPYSQFNFVIDLGIDGSDPTKPDGGFQECSNVGMEVTVAEYRNGNEQLNSVRKITGLNKANDVTLKRGVIGSQNLYNWLDTIRQGHEDQLKNVTITLLSEDRSTQVQVWRLINARIIKYVSGPFNAKGTDVAMEELTLAYERMEMEVPG
jgi:phage tail-like protein